MHDMILYYDTSDDHDLGYVGLRGWVILKHSRSVYALYVMLMTICNSNYIYWLIKLCAIQVTRATFLQWKPRDKPTQHPSLANSHATSYDPWLNATWSVNTFDRGYLNIKKTHPSLCLDPYIFLHMFQFLFKARNEWSNCSPCTYRRAWCGGKSAFPYAVAC